MKGLRTSRQQFECPRRIAGQPIRRLAKKTPRWPALFDEGTLKLISADDDSGMLAATGTVNGSPAVAFCTDATVMGGAMGVDGCEVVVRGLPPRDRRPGPDRRHLALRRRPAGRGRPVACTPSGRSSTR